MRAYQTKTMATTSLDTSIVGNVTLDGKTPVTTGFESSSTKASGIMKTSLIWYRILLTEVGSNPLNKTEGTKLLELFQSNVNDRDVLFSFVKKEVDSATEQVVRYQLQNTAPVEEQLSSVEIATFSMDDTKGSLDVSVNIYSVLGEKANLSLPSIVL